MKRLVWVSLFLLIVLSGASTQHHIEASNKEKDNNVTAIPPTFITLEVLKECDPHAEFPQENPLPYFKEASQLQYSCDVYDKDHVSWAIFVFYEYWEREFGGPGRKVKTALSKIKIEWGEEIMEVTNVYDIDGNFLEKANVSGLMQNRYSIWVLADDYISDTSLVHELVHIALAHSCGSPDADHEGADYPCWTESHSDFIDSVNLELLTTYGL